MTTALLGLICTALIVAVPIACLFLVRPQPPEHKGAIGELITIGGTEFRVTHITWDDRGASIGLADRENWDSMYRIWS